MVIKSVRCGGVDGALWCGLKTGMLAHIACMILIQIFVEPASHALRRRRGLHNAVCTLCEHQSVCVRLCLIGAI